MEPTEFPSVSTQLEMFCIPLDLKHDHSEETFSKMKKGLELLNTFLAGGHDKCVEQMVLYAEMNIKFLFIQSLINRKGVNEALKIFTDNLNKIFFKEGIGE